MENKVLIYLSVIFSVIGLVVIYIVAQNLELSLTSIGKITYDDVGKNVKACGEIVSLFTSKNKHIFFKIRDHTGEMDVVIFNSSADKLKAEELDEGELVCVSGKIDEYEDKLEIIPREITRD